MLVFRLSNRLCRKRTACMHPGRLALIQLQDKAMPGLNFHLSSIHFLFSLVLLLCCRSFTNFHPAEGLWNMSVTEISKGGSGASFTQASAIPLTTLFTPHADCTAASAYESTTWAGNQWAYQLDSGISKPTCYPSSYSDYQYDSGLWYSPGVCPYSYEYVATSVQRPASGNATTLAVCCPP